MKINSIITNVLLGLIVISLIIPNILRYPSQISAQNIPTSYSLSNNSNSNRKRIIIKFKNQYTDRDKRNYLKDKNNKYFEDLNIAIITSANDLELQNYKDDIVESVEFDKYMSIQGINPVDPYYKDQWYIPYSKIDKYWNNLNGLSEQEIKIAVIDSGVCIDHPDLKEKFLHGWNFVDNNENVTDEIGHGCQVSGIIGASQNNIGIAGIVPNNEILPLKVISSNNQGLYSDLAQAIIYATNNQVKIINISLGGSEDSILLEAAIKYAQNKGVYIVASAGNTNSSELLYPAKYQGVIAVGSINNEGYISNFSSYSRHISKWAPGENIITTDLNSSYKAVSGTSFSTSIVTAGLALNIINNDKLNFNGTILNLSSDKQIIPRTRSSKYVDFKDKDYKWDVLYPNNWSRELAFENNTDNNSIISKRIIFYTTSNEIITVDVWNKKDQESLYDSFMKLHAIYLNKEQIPKNINGKVGGIDALIGGDLDTNNQNIMHLFAFFQIDQVIYNVSYSIINGLSKYEYIDFLNNFKVDNKGNSKLESLTSIITKHDSQLSLEAYAEDKCGPNGEYMLSGNPFPCASICTISKTNCVWWAIYKRPDLKTKITFGNAGQKWIDQAKQANLPIYNSVVDGSIVVWEGHVAYVNSHTTNNAFNISEMNCDNASFPGPRDANVKLNYSDSFNFTFLGFIGGGNTNDLMISNTTVSSNVTYIAKNSIIILPTTILNPSSGNVIILKIQP